MNGRLRESAAAKQDLRHIWRYLARFNPRAADDLLRRLRRTADSLAEQPGMGIAQPQIGQNSRRFPAGDYLIFYDVGESEITILRYVHGKRDLPTLLR